jgi:ABC-2 type transport system permease protein
MKGIKKPLDLTASFKTRAFRAGGYSVAAVVIVLAIAVVINLLVSALPAQYTQLDATSNQLFSISDQTKKVLKGLDDSVTVYWVVRSGQEDDTIDSLLDRYKGLSSKITVVKRDPDVYPTFVQQYTDSVSDNSLVVECGERSRYVDYYEIYEYDYSNYYYTGSYDVSFNGESALTSAISYVVSDDLPKVYALTGHGETELSSTFSTAVEKENIELDSLTLLTEGAVPEDADALLICEPQRDISTEEKDLLLAYLQEGGKLLLMTSPLQDGTLTNLEAVMEEYGVTAQEGIVVEGSQSNYAWSRPYCLLPNLSSHDITDPLSENGYNVLLPVAQGLTVDEDLRDGLSVTQLLTTSSSAFSKLAGYNLTTYEKEDGDVDGPFALAVAVTETLDDDLETRIVWVSSGTLVDESYNEMISGGNQDFFLNSLNWMCQQNDDSGLSIHAKSLSRTYLTMSSSVTSSLTILVVALIPLAYLGVGVYIWVRRKRR